MFDYAYDLVGRQTQSALTLNNVSDRIIDTQYDYMGRAVAVRLHGTANSAIDDIMAAFDYNAVGALTDVRRFEWDDTDELYNLIAQSQYQYNARNQITSINHQDSNNSNIVSHGYLYDADGNISQYTNSLDGSVLYDYDFLGQLTGADYSNLLIHDESYQYDLNGNRELVTNANGDLVVYSTGLNNELNSDGNYSYTYDAEGNRISKTNAAGTERELYSWDYRNRLESVTKQEYNVTTQEWETVQIVEYAYDYNNVLIRKVLDADGDGISDSKTIFLPENYQTAIQLDDADLSDSTYETVSHRYLWTPGQQDKLLADVTPTETLWTLTDHLGTIRDIVKNTPSGLVVPAHIIYDAYGNVLSCKDANGTNVSNPVLFGFTGKYFDADTQLQNNVNRWYDSAIGRWLSTDPIGFNGNDTNLYRYVGNKITQFIDYLGYKSCRCEQLLEQFVKSEQFQFDLYLAGKKDSYFLSNGNKIYFLREKDLPDYLRDDKLKRNYQIDESYQLSQNVKRWDRTRNSKINFKDLFSRKQYTIRISCGDCLSSHGAIASVQCKGNGLRNICLSKNRLENVNPKTFNLILLHEIAHLITKPDYICKSKPTINECLAAESEAHAYAYDTVMLYNPDVITEVPNDISTLFLMREMFIKYAAYLSCKYLGVKDNPCSNREKLSPYEVKVCDYLDTLAPKN